MRDSYSHQQVIDNHLRKYPAAKRFVETIFTCSQDMDDLHDEGSLDSLSIERLMTNIFARLPIDPFFDKYKSYLYPLMISAIGCWRVANFLEECCGEDEEYLRHAYILRNMDSLIFAMTVALCELENGNETEMLRPFTQALRDVTTTIMREERGKAYENYKKEHLGEEK